MTFSNEWDQRYIENTHVSVWPWSDLVSLVRRHCRHLEGGRVLELGCGAGANIPFFQLLGVQYHAVEGSPSVVKRLHERFPDLAQRITVGDFTANQPFEPGFDLVVDRAALTHNSTTGIESGLQLAWQALKPGGYFIGVDWFSANHSEYRRGTADVDEHTRTNYHDGQFAGVGRVHFSDAAHLRKLFSRFELLFLEEKLLQRVVPEGDYQFASWNLVARKLNP
jgi:SAM-dependent methyltransferase